MSIMKNGPHLLQDPREGLQLAVLLAAITWTTQRG